MNHSAWLVTETPAYSTSYPGAFGPARKGGAQWDGRPPQPKQSAWAPVLISLHASGRPHIRPVTLPGPWPAHLSNELDSMISKALRALTLAEIIDLLAREFLYFSSGIRLL